MHDSENVYQVNTKSLCEYNSDDVKKWSGIYSFLSFNKTTVDRSNSIKMPFNFKIYDRFSLPKLDKNFSKSFEEICLSRAKDILEKQSLKSKPIYLFYSGGIDSVTALISFLKVIPLSEAKDKITIVMTSDSIAEYPEFYYKIIRPNFKILGADSFPDFFNKEHLLVTGGLGDKIFGTDNIGKIYRLGMFDQVKETYNKKFITGFWNTLGIDDRSAEVWYDLLDVSIRSNDVNINTNFDFLWWFNFLLEWQSEYFLFSIRSGSSLDKTFYDEYLFAFYESYDFQQWSMINPHLKIKDQWKSYKFTAKDFIYSYTGDQKYRDDKIKGLSLNRIYYGKKMPMGIRENLDYFESIDITRLYNAENSFR